MKEIIEFSENLYQDALQKIASGQVADGLDIFTTIETLLDGKRGRDVSALLTKMTQQKMALAQSPSTESNTEDTDAESTEDLKEEIRLKIKRTIDLEKKAAQYMQCNQFEKAAETYKGLRDHLLQNQRIDQNRIAETYWNEAMAIYSLANELHAGNPSVHSQLHHKTRDLLEKAKENYLSDADRQACISFIRKLSKAECKSILSSNAEKSLDSAYAAIHDIRVKSLPMIDQYQIALQHLNLTLETLSTLPALSEYDKENKMYAEKIKAQILFNMHEKGPNPYSQRSETEATESDRKRQRMSID